VGLSSQQGETMNHNLEHLLKQKQELEMEIEYTISETHRERLEQELAELEHSINIVKDYDYQIR